MPPTCYNLGMKRLSALVSLLVVALALVYGWQYLTALVSPCAKPVAYRLGQLDSRFNITVAQAEKDIQQAAEIWNTAAAKKLFKEDARAGLTVNFVYDQRQALSSKIGAQENNLNNDRQTLDAQLAAYLRQKADFEAKLAALNAEIDNRNRSGGSSPEVYQQLQEQTQSLMAEQEQLRGLAAGLNQNTDSYNVAVTQLNSTVNDFNTAIGQKPEGGLFDGTTGTIYIYLDPSQKELIHTLAHEFGHSLGMLHLNDPQAIMYSYTSESLLPDRADQSELARTCQAFSRLWVWLPTAKERLNNLVTSLLAKIKL